MLRAQYNRTRLGSTLVSTTFFIDSWCALYFRMSVLYCDGGYQGPKAATAAAKTGR
jgi:hypothetical protein